MTRKTIGIGAGLGVLALAVGGVMYQSVARARRRRITLEEDARVAAWEAEGGALEESMPGPSGRRSGLGGDGQWAPGSEPAVKGL